MRRATPTPAISPRQLKHFAAVTVLITLLVALFASGEDWGARARIDSIDARNQLIATEKEKLGATKLTVKLNLRQPELGNGFGTDEGGSGDAEKGGSWGRQIARTTAQVPGPRQRLNGIPALEQRAGARVTVNGADIEDVLQPDPARRKNGKASGAFIPDAQQKQKIEETSRQRTGASTAGEE